MTELRDTGQDADLIVRLDRAIAAINQAAAPVVLDRIAALGEEASGAGNFYAVRARRGEVFSGYDRALVLAIAGWSRAPRRIIEVGGGIGSFAMLAAVAGFDVTSVEFNPHRIGLAEALAPVIAAAAPETRGRYRVVRARYPNRRVAQPDALLVATNFVTGSTPEQAAAIVAAVVAQPWFVVDVDRFLDKTADAQERAWTVRRFEAAGAAGAPFLDLGDEARFWRFRGKRTG